MADFEYLREAPGLQSHSPSHIITEISNCIERWSAYFLSISSGLLFPYHILYILLREQAIT
jgi:hypothetical protein